MRSLKYPNLKLTVSMVIQIQAITYFSKTLRQDWQDWNAGIAALGRKKHWRAALATAEEMHHRRHGGDIQNGKWNEGILHVWMHLLL